MANNLLNTRGFMESKIIALASDPLLTVGGFVIGVLGIVLAIVFYFKSKKEKTPCYEVSSDTLIEGIDKALDGLQLRYKGHPQSRITVTKIIFWNDGHETIDKGDLVAIDPVRVICPSSVTILDIQVTQASFHSNAVSLGDEEKTTEHTSYPINFEYLDHKNFFIIQIVHNGDERANFSIGGKIKGVDKITLVFNGTAKFPSTLRLIAQFQKLMASRVIMKYIGASIYLFLAGYGVWALTHGQTEWYVWAGTVFCAFGFAIWYFEMHRRIAPVNI
jgi:hypothetical protein